MPAVSVISRSRSHRRRWWALGVLSLGLFMASLDNTILNVALPTLAFDLSASTDELQWTVDAYQVTYAGLLLVAGSLVDRWGKSRTFLVGTLLFGAFSLMAGLVSTTGLLIGARALMGVGAALLAPSTLALVSRLFVNPHERTVAFALWSGANGAGGAVGPLLSGVLLEHFRWGAIFLINVPVALVIVVGGLVVLPHGQPRKTGAGIDSPGAALSILALALLCWSVISAPGLGVFSPLVVAAFLGGAVLMVVFVVRESQTQHPILRLGLFRNRRFSVAVAVSGLVTAGGAGALFVLTQYLQFSLNYSPLETGVRILPVAAAMFGGAMAAPHLMQHILLKRTVLVGLGSVVAGFGWLSATTTQTTFTQLLPGALLFGLGAGLLVPAATQAVMDSLPPDASGVGSATNTALMQVGSALGVAVIGALLSARYRDVVESSDVFGQLGQWQHDVLQSMAAAIKAIPNLPADVGSRLDGVVQSAFIEGMRLSLMTSTLAVFLALVAVAVLYPRDRRV